MAGPSRSLLNSLLGGAIFIPITFLFITLPKESSVFIICGITLNVSSSLFLKTLILISQPFFFNL